MKLQFYFKNPNLNKSNLKPKLEFKLLSGLGYFPATIKLYQTVNVAIDHLQESLISGHFELLSPLDQLLHVAVHARDVVGQIGCEVVLGVGLNQPLVVGLFVPHQVKLKVFELVY